MIGVSITNQFVKVGDMGLGSSLSFVLLGFLISGYLGVRLLARLSGLVPKSGGG
jgi:ABC-type spermidine/putrescine transport system permease subunit I